MSSIETTSSPADIPKWQPTKWDEIIGNRSLVRHFQTFVRKTRQTIEHGTPADINSPPLLITGPSRSGKTSATKFMVRCLGCQQLRPSTLNPCDGSCFFCRQRPELYDLEGVISQVTFGDVLVPIHFTHVDCTKLRSPEELLRKLNSLGSVYHGIRILYFDEVHRLQQRGMDEMLLKTVEDTSAVWLFSTAKPEGLEDMFVNRLMHFSTELPSIEAMAHWIVDRCQQWGIPYEDEAVIRTVEKSNHACGIALLALSLAALDDRGLSLDLVENGWFPPGKV